MELEPGERDLLLHIFEAERVWADGGHEEIAFNLMFTGGMQRHVDHPGWDGSWATPSKRQIDDPEEYGLLRVEPHPPNRNPRTFELSPAGRRTAKELAEADLSSGSKASQPPGPRPSLIDVLAWLGSLDAATLALGAGVLQAAIVQFGPGQLETVSAAIRDLNDEGLVRFLDPMASLSGWDHATRIGKASNFRLTFAGEQRLSQTSTGGTTINIGSIGQFAAGDIINVTLTQEVVDLAIEQLAEQSVGPEMRAEARSLIERAKARGMDVLVAAAGTDAGAVALAAVRHALHLKGLG